MARYELIQLIGCGGMGEVWAARHLELDAAIAIKFAHERCLGERSFGERFRREARALAKLRIPEIVQIYDVGEVRGQPFLVMELLQGESLRTHLERRHRISLGEAAILTRQIGKALFAIHREKMVHRDVTPGNIFMSRLDDAEETTCAKLLDFGIAKPEDASAVTTTTGAILGSPSYMSPEQARAEPVNAQSDLWSLGAVLFRALTGRDAFVGASVTDVLIAVCTAPIPSVNEFVPGLSSNVDRFFEYAFARNRSHRYASIGEFCDAFEQLLDTAATTTPLAIPTTSDQSVCVTSRAETTAVELSIRAVPRSISRWRVPLLVLTSAMAASLMAALSFPVTYSGQHVEPRSELDDLPASTIVPSVEGKVDQPPPAGSSPTVSSTNESKPRIAKSLRVRNDARQRRVLAQPPQQVELAVDPLFGLPLESKPRREP